MNNSGWSRTESPFHAGELAIQDRLGVRERVDRQGRLMIREYLTTQHQQFFSQLSYLIIGTVDESDNPWSSIVVGEPGFIKVISDRKLQIDASILTGDPLAVTLKEGADIGLLGIELHTRRRNRVNGIVTKVERDRFEVEVRQTFGNCPQYIQARTFVRERSSDLPQIESIVSLSRWENDSIANADTFFIATAYQDSSGGINKGVDVSHRGGKPGFIKVNDKQTLTIPDFSGNNHFNTIGNLELNPRAGLLFVDFANKSLLYLTGTTEIIWSGKEVNSFVGAERLIRFYLKQGYRVRDSLPLSWSNPEFSPSLENHGS